MSHNDHLGAVSEQPPDDWGGLMDHDGGDEKEDDSEQHAST